MVCPYLEYRREGDDVEFDHERPFCALMEEFVSPMRADICNDRFEFHHAEHCEYFRAAVREGEAIQYVAPDGEEPLDAGAADE